MVLVIVLYEWLTLSIMRGSPGKMILFICISTTSPHEVLYCCTISRGGARIHSVDASHIYVSGEVGMSPTLKMIQCFKQVNAVKYETFDFK